MTSFVAHIIEECGFNPTFKLISAWESKRDHKSVILTLNLHIQGQIHHQIELCDCLKMHSIKSSKFIVWVIGKINLIGVSQSKV